MSGCIDWLGKYMNDTIEQVKHEYDLQVEDILAEPVANSREHKLRSKKLENLERKFDFDNYIDSQKQLLKCRRSAFDTFTDREYLIVCELYKMGLADSYFSDVSLGVSDRLNKAKILSSFSSEIMKIPVPRPEYYQAILKKNKNDKHITIKPFKLNKLKFPKASQKSSKSKSKNSDPEYKLTPRDLRIGNCADRSVVKLPFTQRL